jgi:hypothetical protein
LNEQAIIQALRNLPVSVQVWPLRSGAGGYSWQCLDASGRSDDLASVLSESLTFLIGRLAGDTGVLDDIRGMQ